MRRPCPTRVARTAVPPEKFLRDVAAARGAKAGTPELKALAQSVRDLAKQDRGEVQAAAQAARDAIKALKGSAPKGPAPTSTTTTSK